MSRILVVAGEASGDERAARLLASLRARVEGLEAFGLGGDELAAAGLDSLAHSREVAVVGITEVLRVLPRARAVFRELLAAVRERRPELAILVDFPDFNLPLARRLRRLDVPVVYYVSPQVWAWRRGRIRSIARNVDLMLVLFPFEAGFYESAGVRVEHVGHPLVDEVPELPGDWPESSADGPHRLVLLPGSRSSEVEALLPTMIAAARRMAADRELEVSLIQAPTVPGELYDRLIPPDLAVERVRRERYAAIARAHVALCASGTATLEVALLGTPLVVLYRLQPLTYLLAKLLVRLPYFSLVNLVLEEAVVPELLQGEANPERAAAEAGRLLDDAPARAALRSRLAEVRGRLGEGGASERAAAAVADLLRREGAAA